MLKAFSPTQLQAVSLYLLLGMSSDFRWLKDMFGACKVPQNGTVTSCQSSRAARRIHSSPVTGVVAWLPVISTKDTTALPVSLGGVFFNGHFLKNKQWHMALQWPTIQCCKAKKQRHIFTTSWRAWVYIASPLPSFRAAHTTLGTSAAWRRCSVRGILDPSEKQSSNFVLKV